MTLQQQEDFQRLRLFNIASSVAKNGKPYTNYADIIQLGKLQKGNFFQALPVKWIRIPWFHKFLFRVFIQQESQKQTIKEQFYYHTIYDCRSILDNCFKNIQEELFAMVRKNNETQIKGEKQLEDSVKFMSSKFDEQERLEKEAAIVELKI